MELLHLIRAAEQRWHRSKRLAPKIHIQPGNNHADTPVRQLLGDRFDSGVEELRFVNRYDGGIGGKLV